MIVSILGTDFASDNRGCRALGYSAIEILKKLSSERKEKLEIYAVVFSTDIQPYVSDVEIKCIEIKPKKVSCWMTCKKIFQNSELVIDFTGGDSFSDIYGFKRFLIMSLFKELAIIGKSKFIMAPQTIGPFISNFSKQWAKRIVRKSAACFVRDSLSEEYVQREFKVSPYLTTDVAFLLPYDVVKKQDSEKIRVGINVSGLLWMKNTGLKTQKNLRMDYQSYNKALFEYLLNDGKYEILLIPHVFTKEGVHYENDLQACEELKEKYPGAKIVSEFDTPMEAKTIIAQMDVFIGARMHATIASYSAGVATIPIAYSRKFLGMFGDLGYQYIIDMEKDENQVALEKTIRWIEDYKVLERCIECNKVKVMEKQQVFYNALKDMSK